MCATCCPFTTTTASCDVTDGNHQHKTAFLNLKKIIHRDGRDGTNAEHSSSSPVTRSSGLHQEFNPDCTEVPAVATTTREGEFPPRR